MKTYFLLLLLSCSLAAQENTGTWSQKKTIPRWARQEFKNHHFDRDYVVTYQLYPPYFRGDFNGDGRQDVAILLAEKSSGKFGIAIFHAKWPQAIYTQHFILGAGIPFGNTGGDLKWMNVWSLIEEHKASLTLTDKNLPALTGDAIKAEQRDGKKGLIYWDGKKYAWHKLSK